MSSIDDLFKKPNGLVTGNKRKLEPPPRNLDEIKKAAKTSTNGDVKGKQDATVEDEASAQEEDDDLEAGPELPPDDDEEAGPEPEDEEGARFFGGGTNKHTNDALDYVEDHEEDLAEPEQIDNSWLRRTLLAFERKVSKNTELRDKYADDPMKFIESEGELDADIKALSILSEHPELYPELAKMGSMNSLVQLLIHENTDIALNAIQIIAELIDEDVEANEEQWTAVVDALLNADIIDLLVSVVRSLNEDKEEDKEGVYHAMELIESLVNSATTSEKIFTDDTNDKLLKYLMERTQKAEKPVSQNKQYAAELISIIASQASPSAANLNTARRRLLDLNATDAFLQLVAPYRKIDPPKKSNEEQMVEDAFDILDCLVEPADGKTKFMEAEGVELALIMIREGGKLAKARSLRLLDHALSSSSQSSVALCERFVDATGLKPLFKIFTSIVERRDREGTEHVLGIMASLLRCLPDKSSGRIRTLAKFTEKGYEKIEKLVRLREAYAKKVDRVTDSIEEEKRATEDPAEREEKELDWITRRLDAGLFTFQTISVILAWLYAEDEGAAKKVQTAMQQSAGGFEGLRRTLAEQLDGIGTETDEEQASRDMLQTLIECL